MSVFKMEPYDPLILNGDLDENGFGYSPINHHDPDSEIQTGPYLSIIEQPKQRGFRFRYVCEGPSHGGLPGASSEKGKKTYPTVKIFNYVGMAKIEVDLVTHTDPPRVHAHSLVGKHASEMGNCVVTVGPKDMTAQFNNLGIVHVTKKSQVDILKEKIRRQLLRNCRGPRTLTEHDEKKIDADVKELKKVTDLSIVRLRFTAYLPDSTGAYTLPLKPVISDPIHDSKSPGASNLRISRMDKISGSVQGGDEVYLLCDKVQKDDIEVRFYEDDENGWQAFGDFSPTDVHKQYAIVFRTPPYHNKKIDRPVTVFLQLKRKRGGDVSDSKQFTYYPVEQDKEEVERKRRKDLPSLNHYGGGAPMGGAGGGSGGFGHGGGNNMNFTYGGMHTGFYTPSGGVYPGVGYTVSNAPSDSSPQSQPLPNVKKEEPPASPSQEGSTSQSRDSQRGDAQQAHICDIRMLTLAQRTSKALMGYAITADPRMLLAIQRPLVATRDQNGDTPLHLAIIHGQTTVIQQLVDVLQDVPNQHIFNLCNNLHQTPLHLGVITKQYQTVCLLLRAGADPTILDRYGNSVLHLAVQTGDVKMLEVLLEYTYPKYQNLLNMPDYNGLYPVHWAVKAKNEKCLEQLVRSGADVNAAERKSGRSPLHIAVEMDNLNMAISLVKKLGADVNAQTFGGNTPLHLAASLGSPVLTRMLINAGANALLENDEPVRSATAVYSDSDDTDNDSDVQMDIDSDQQGDNSSEEEETIDTDQDNRRISCGVKRRYSGHTPLDLTQSQKVRDILSKHSSGGIARNPAKHEPVNVLSLETNTVKRLERLLNEGQTGSDWTELASRLRLHSLVDTYRNTSSPTESLLRCYEFAGGSLHELIQTLQAMGLNEGVELLRKSETYIKQENQEPKVDSAYGSQSVDNGYESQSTTSEPQKPSPAGSTRLSPTHELTPRTEPASGQ
ncbi:nuclear factor NF-kappa-B p100 subunit isoform 2-T2 [Leptodactylus fuscus]|uniref:nuclear factor NF-kappa-B p100 subunit isoform X2 n=1 Tax=Leptodactylus fuscus TaxID=238119 RepID=UPI003F4EF612